MHGDAARESTHLSSIAAAGRAPRHAAGHSRREARARARAIPPLEAHRDPDGLLRERRGRPRGDDRQCKPLRYGVRRERACDEVRGAREGGHDELRTGCIQSTPQPDEAKGGGKCTTECVAEEESYDIAWRTWKENEPGTS